MKAASAGFPHNRWLPETGSQPREVGKSHTLVPTETACLGARQLSRGYLLES